MEKLADGLIQQPKSLGGKMNKVFCIVTQMYIDSEDCLKCPKWDDCEFKIRPPFPKTATLCSLVILVMAVFGVYSFMAEVLFPYLRTL